MSTEGAREAIRDLAASAQGAGARKGLTPAERHVLAILALAAAVRYVGDVLAATPSRSTEGTTEQ